MILAVPRICSVTKFQCGYVLTFFFSSLLMGFACPLERPSQTKTYAYTRAPSSAQLINAKYHGYHPPKTQENQSNRTSLKELREQAKHAVLALLPILSREDFRKEGVNMDVLRNLLRELNMLEHFERPQNQCLHPPSPTTTAHVKSTQPAPFIDKHLADHSSRTKHIDGQAPLRPSELARKESVSHTQPVVHDQHTKERNDQSSSEHPEVIGGRQLSNIVSNIHSTDTKTGLIRTEDEKAQLQHKLKKRMEEMKTLPKVSPSLEPPAQSILAHRHPGGPSKSSGMSLEHDRTISPIVSSTSPQMMIPGLLLDSMDLGIRIPETPMAPATPTENSSQSHQDVANTEANGALHNPALNMVEVGPENRVASRRKRPVAADFDSMTFSQPYPKRRFGALDCNPVILEITDDEDEELSDHREDVSGRYDRGESCDHSSKNSNTPTGAHEQETENRRVSPAAAAVSAKRMLDSKEEEIRKLKERILQYERKKRESININNNIRSAHSTTLPTRVSTPIVIPGLNIEDHADIPSVSSAESTQEITQGLVHAPYTHPESIILPSSQDSSLQLDNSRTHIMSSSTSGENAQNADNLTDESTSSSIKETASMKSLRSKSPISTKQSGEVERLRKLLISKRKAAGGIVYQGSSSVFTTNLY